MKIRRYYVLILGIYLALSPVFPSVSAFAASDADEEPADMPDEKEEIPARAESPRTIEQPDEEIPAPSSEEREEKAEEPLSEEDAYVLQTGDRINLKIFPEDEYLKGGQMQISSDGNLTLPLLGKVKVAGMNVLKAQRELARIIDKDYLVNPEVVIEVLQYRVYNFVILGEVRKPGTFTFPEGSNKLTLLQAISMAGGFSELANTKRIKIVRSHGGQNQVIRANAEAIISGNDPDIELKPNDVINVSQSLF